MPEQFQPESYQSLLAEKVERVARLLRPFTPSPPLVHPSPPEGFRMRCEFRVWHDGDALDYVMFRGTGGRERIKVNDFPAACERIRELMPALRARLTRTVVLRRKLFQVEFMATLRGEALVTLIYHRRLDADWSEEAQALAEALHVGIVGRSRGQKRVIGRDFVTERLLLFDREFHFRQYEQSFTQPNAVINGEMIRWAAARAGGDDTDLLELYCGNGNFTFPLAKRFRRVIATEVAKTAVRAARENRELNDIDNVDLVRMSAQEISQAIAGERAFRRLQALPWQLADYRLETLLVDPPRAGLDETTMRMATGFDTVVYISCNPITLAANLETLCVSHDVTDFALFDQFPYTDHMESAVILRRR